MGPPQTDDPAMTGTAHVGRVFVAFLAAPLVPGVLVALGVASFAVASGVRVVPSDLAGVLFTAAVLGYPAELLVGLLAYHILRTLSLDSVWVYALAGLVFGGILFLMYPLLPGLSHATFDLVLIPVVVACCMAATLSFWAIARPDRRPRYPGP